MTHTSCHPGHVGIPGAPPIFAIDHCDRTALNAGEHHPSSLPCLGDARWSLSYCRAGASRYEETSGVHLVTVWSFVASCRLHQVTVVHTQSGARVRHALVSCPQAGPVIVRPGSRSCVASFGWAPSRPWEHCSIGSRAGFGPLAEGFIEILFHFSFSLNSTLNFKNSYLSVQCSKNYEIGSVGFKY
jgi:hypothetical protein